MARLFQRAMPGYTRAAPPFYKSSHGGSSIAWTNGLRWKTYSNLAQHRSHQQQNNIQRGRGGRRYFTLGDHIQTFKKSDENYFITLYGL